MIAGSKKYIIEIDTTQRDHKTVVLKKEDKIVDRENNSKDIISTINSILNRNNLSLENDIIEVVPNVGPGSFTGIKVGITIANTINWQLGNKKEYQPNYGGEPNISTPKHT